MSPGDFAQIARDVVDKATGQPTRSRDDEDTERHQRAVETGREGGIKGGRARADKLTAEERSASARKAAEARWQRRSDGG